MKKTKTEQEVFTGTSKEKETVRGKFKKWLKGFKGANPKEDFDARHRHTIRNISVGAVLVTIALIICIYQVSILRGTYATRLSDEFQAHHENAAASLDSMISYQTGLLEVCARNLADDGVPSENAKVQSIIKEYSSIEGIETLAFVSLNGDCYANDRLYLASSVKDEVDALMAKVDGSKNSTVFMTQDSFETKLWSDHERRIIICTPVLVSGSINGYVVGTIQLGGLLDRTNFSYQNDMGECYIVDDDGFIAARSADALMMPEENEFDIGLLAYSDGKDESKRLAQQIITARNSGEAGFVSIVTSKGDNVQVSYCMLHAVDNAMIISCYNDNIVDDLVQPLIFKNVLSCAIVIVLMIAIVVFVWASSKRSGAMIEKLAYEDPVTKGRNVNYFKEFANMVLAIYGESSFMIYRFDIANFRYINEVYGHYRADKILKTVIKAFDDNFTNRELCVRMNADQYLAIVVNDGSLRERMDHFKDEVNAMVKSDGIKYPIRFKMGECQFSKHDHDIDIVIDHANVARKTLGKEDTGESAKYTGKVVDEMNRIESIEQRQETALAHKEFKVFLQPKWDIFEDHVVGAEALVRWTRNDGRIMNPEDFVPIFEKNGFIERLDFHMLDEVCRIMRETVDKGGIVYPISVNQSRLLLHSPDYVDNVVKIMNKYNIPPGAIELEITETVFEEDRAEMIRIMNELRSHGLKLAMDDFGSGYSSLNMLKDIPFDVLKIDRDFFSQTVNGEKSRWILQKIIEMSDGLGMDVVCEGVETAEQVEVLKYLKCHTVQGYYYAKPMPAADYMDKYCLVNNIG
ncbi:MAG: GGDEF domain-containing protein [Lachnospiraceae bacterium]|nr:GGDEF domain-containing protein [Lachnospiraceae bacterium]